jgi:hypothetical protein
MVSAVGFRLVNDALRLPNVNKASSNNNARFFRAMLFKKQAPGKTYLGYQGKGYPLD